MDCPPQGINKVSKKWVKILKKYELESVKRLKKVEQDYLHTSQKYTETRSQWLSLHDEKRRAVKRCHSAADFIDWCSMVVGNLQIALDKLPTTETTEGVIDHFLMLKSGKSLAQENLMTVQQETQCQKLDSEAIRSFKEISHEIKWFQRKMSRRDGRKAVHDLLKEGKEKNKCRDKALTNCILICNSTNLENLRKPLELELKILKKLIKELQRDWEEKLHIEQYARNIYTDFKQKVKHLEKKKEHLSGQWDEARKYMLGTKKKNNGRIGTYPEAKTNHDDL